jgi:hypothetical protein
VIACLSTAEDLESTGVTSLKKTSFVPLDADILFWMCPTLSLYKGNAYQAIHNKWTCKEIQSYCAKQVHRQVFLFASLLQKGVYSCDELEGKFKIYITKDLLHSIFQIALGQNTVWDLFGKPRQYGKREFCEQDLRLLLT